MECQHHEPMKEDWIDRKKQQTLLKGERVGLDPTYNFNGWKKIDPWICDFSAAFPLVLQPQLILKILFARDLELPGIV